jgi:hypothetical protein
MDKNQQIVLIEMAKKHCENYIRQYDTGRLPTYKPIDEAYHRCKQWLEIYNLSMSLKDKKGIWKNYE